MKWHGYTVVMQWALTHVEHKTGLRRLTLSCTGRDTYTTRAAAQADLDALSGPEGLVKVLLPEELRTLEVREVPCWPGSLDPVGVYAFEEEEKS